MIRQESDNGVYNPAMLNNRLLDNGGPAIDIDRVVGGVIAGNAIQRQSGLGSHQRECKQLDDYGKQHQPPSKRQPTASGPHGMLAYTR